MLCICDSWCNIPLAAGARNERVAGNPRRRIGVTIRRSLEPIPSELPFSMGGLESGREKSSLGRPARAETNVTATSFP